MSWTTHTVTAWSCDFCAAEWVSTDDLQPEGWVHDQAGHDRCPRCTTKQCGCDDGACTIEAPTFAGVGA